MLFLVWSLWFMYHQWQWQNLSERSSGPVFICHTSSRGEIYVVAGGNVVSCGISEIRGHKGHGVHP
jgi:hypothetical protein